ncbi:hypothetical protein Tco_0866411 [Tanacetum coccineum]
MTKRYCPGVLGGDTGNGSTYFYGTARVFLEETPVTGVHILLYCPGVLGGDTDNVVIFEGSSLSLFGMELAKSCEAKRLESSGFKEVTRSSASGLSLGNHG